MQSCLTSEDIALTTKEFKTLRDELKNAQGKRLIKSKMISMRKKNSSSKGE